MLKSFCDICKVETTNKPRGEIELAFRGKKREDNKYYHICEICYIDIVVFLKNKIAP